MPLADIADIAEKFFQMTVIAMTALFLAAGIKVCFYWKHLEN